MKKLNELTEEDAFALITIMQKTIEYSQSLEDAGWEIIEQYDDFESTLLGEIDVNYPEFILVSKKGIYNVEGRNHKILQEVEGGFKCAVYLIKKDYDCGQ